MKLSKNQQGYTEIITVSIILGIIGALFITSVFIWQEINGTKEINRILISANKDKAKETKYLGWTNCINTSSAGRGTDGVKKMLLEYKNVKQEIFDNFFENPELNELLIDGRIIQVCQSIDKEVSFVIYGLSADHSYNNVIGIYDGENLIFDKKHNVGGGDEGICTIDGYIERNILYSCGGGDGPWGHNGTYVLNKKTGESITLKHCYVDHETDAQCDVNLLNLQTVPF